MGLRVLPRIRNGRAWLRAQRRRAGVWLRTGDFDGPMKNAQKLFIGWCAIRERWALHSTRRGGSHAYVDRFVEAARASPYVVGHVDAVLYPVLLVLAGIGWALYYNAR